MVQKGQHITLALTIIVGLASTFLFISWLVDSHHLRQIAVAQTAGARSDSERIIKLTDWVYSNKGFKKNRGYFFIRKLGPTSINVLNAGGDCADKSRLLSAMLRQIGIRSTLAMLYPCRECPPGHTVVEAKYEHGMMVVDSVYNIWFPANPNEYYDENYLGLLELISNPELLPERLHYLRQQRGPDDKINRYNSNAAIFTYARTINWEKNALTRIVGDAIEMLDGNPYLLQRPYVMEDPKLALVFMSGIITIALLIVFILFRRAAILKER